MSIKHSNASAWEKNTRTTTKAILLGFTCLQWPDCGPKIGSKFYCRFVPRGARAPQQSLALYAGCADYLAPLLRKFDNEFAELGGRAYKWFCAQIAEPRFERRISKDGIHLLIEDRDDLRRRVRGCSNAIPTERLVTRHKIPDRGNIRQCVQTCRGRDP